MSCSYNVVYALLVRKLGPQEFDPFTRSFYGTKTARLEGVDIPSIAEPAENKRILAAILTEGGFPYTATVTFTH